MSEEQIAEGEDQNSRPEYKIPDELRPIIDRLPEPQREAVVAILFGISIKRHTFSSPIPPPEILKGYNEAIPGAADRILKMAEKQSAHRIQMEEYVIHQQQKQSWRGQHYGLIIALAFLIASFVLIYTGHDISGYFRNY